MTASRNALSTPVVPSNPLNKELVTRPSNSSMMRAAANSVAAAFQAIGHVLANNPSDGVAAEAYHYINHAWLKPIDELRAATRDLLISRVQAAPSGRLDAKRGDLTFKLSVTEPKSRMPDAGKVLNLCEEKGIKVEQLCDADVVYVPSLNKIERALADGIITEEEVGACYKSLGRRLSVEKV